MSNKLRISSPWAQFGVFIGMAGASLITFVLLAGLVYQLAGMGHLAESDLLLNNPKAIGVAKIVQVLFSVTVFGLTGFMYARITYPPGPLQHLGLRPALDKYFYLFAILLLLFALPLESWLGELNKRLPLAGWMIQQERANDHQVEIFMKVSQPSDWVVNVLVMAAIPAFCEELCFRGALQRIMIRICHRPIAGIVISAFLFSFLHFQFEGFLPRMFLGTLLGAAYWYSGSLWVPIVGHLFFNAAQIIAVMAYPALLTKDASTPLAYALVSMVLVVFLLIVFRKRSTTTYEAVYGPEENEFHDFLT